MTKQSISLLAAVGVLAAAGITAFGQTAEPVVDYYWTPATDGSPAVEYVVRVEIDGDVMTWPETVTEPRFTWPAYPYGQTLRVSVAGRDSSGRDGGFSEWSTLWTDYGPPGDPGTPQHTLGFK